VVECLSGKRKALGSVLSSGKKKREKEKEKEKDLSTWAGEMAHMQKISIKKVYLLIIYKYTVAVFRQLQMVVSHHVVARN